MSNQSKVLAGSRKTRGFYQVVLPTGMLADMPDDIEVVVPRAATVSKAQQQVLTCIPWSDKYLHYILAEYRGFFRAVLPYLHKRTTDVHTALSVSLVPELIWGTPGNIDERIVYIATILHDSGWGQMSDQEIADSLSYSGLYAEAARAPKERHGTLGAELSRKILDEYHFTPELSAADKQYICDIVYYHDQMRLWPAEKGPEPIEYTLVVEADRLWSYTHDNFWLDTIRKNTPPRAYLRNLEAALDDYFLTDVGHDIARRLISERRVEVDSLLAGVASANHIV
jgi:hypothetical protein